MGVIKVETFDFSPTNDGDTHTLTNDVGNLNDAFIRKITSSDKATGPSGSTGNANPQDAHVGLELTATNTITARKGTATQQRVMGEVWRYTGAGGGADEFIVRDRVQVTVTGASQSVATSGIVDRNRCIPIITGMECASGGTSDYDVATVCAHIDSSNNVVITKNNAGSLTTQIVYVTVVEFTGSNWRVGHAISSSHNGVNETVTLNTDSTGSGGSTFDTGNWNNAMIIEATMGGDSSETGLADNLLIVYPAGTTTQVVVDMDTGDGNANNDADAYIHVLVNSGMTVYRADDQNISEGNGTTGTAAWPGGAPTTENLDELSLEWFVSTSGVGTAHARGRLAARITAASGTITHWVHRSGNNVVVHYGVVTLGNLDDTSKPVIETGPASVPIGGGNDIIITGSNFEAVQGTGKVEISNNSSYGAGGLVEQSIDSWSDTSIQFDFDDVTGLTEGIAYIWVTNDGGGSSSFQFSYGNPSYEDEINGMATPPDHHWPFDNSYDNIGATQNGPASSNAGTPTFTTNPLTRGRTHALTIDGATDRVEAPDNNEMNLSALTARTMAGWFRITETQSAFICLYEEGGGVNNLAFFIGVGGIVIAQLADTGDDNVHAYSDFKIDPNRTYMIALTFDYGGDDTFRLSVDGVEQSVTFGNPLTATDLDGHSGDIGWGDAEGTLEVFGTDITFPPAVTSYYNDWFSWRVALTETVLRETVFELGVIGDIQIVADTEANMQTAIDVYADTVRPNSDCNFRIAGSSEGNFTLELDNITFDDATSIAIQYIGTNTLTVKNLNGSNLSSDKVSTPYGGTVTIITPAVVTVTGLIAGSEVRIFEAGTTTEIGGIESSGTSFSLSVEVASVDISILALGYQNLKLKNQSSASDTTIPVVQQVDRQYDNP